ncbi:C69 family dipeptidase [Leptospira sp. 96542]|nr:C69 family dipeptidase [Leptospira sp. 96542]
MCNTSLATEFFTKSQKRVFAKNSGREPNEAQAILHVPRQIFEKNSKLKTTYIEIPQVSQTNEVFLCKPFHIWGAEMGVNEFGVTIGYEAIFSNLKIPKKNIGLTGMDLLRLALERTSSARQALFLITELLESYGQVAYGSYANRPFFYNSSFIIADRTDGYLLETADKFWVAKKISDFCAITNHLTIDSDFDFSSKSLENKLLNTNDFSFKRTFSNSFCTYINGSKERRKLNIKMANTSIAKHNSYTAMESIQNLKTHSISEDEFEPCNSNMKSLCLHAKGLTTPIQTNGSLVVEWDISELNPDPIRIFYTGTSSPCLSVFKPFYFGTKNLVEQSSLLPNQNYSETLWWLHESINRRANYDYQSVRSVLLPTMIGLQESIFSNYKESLSLQKKEETQWKFLKDHVNLLKTTYSELNLHKLGVSRLQNPFFHMYWKNQNKNLNLPGFNE